MSDDPQGAIDNDYDDAERSAREILEANQPPVTDVMVEGVAFDLVKRQPLYVRQRVADDLVEYYEQEEFDLLNYNQHPYLPVTIDDPVYECVFLGNAEGLHNCNKTYDYPAGRLAVIPVHEAWTDDGGDGS
jgi:hypothetical protein